MTDCWIKGQVIGGTTYAALPSMETAGVKAAFVAAMRAAEQRAGELGDEFGR